MERERERERERGRVLRQMGCGMGNKLDCMAARDRITQDLIKMNIKIISKNLGGIVFLSRYSDFSSISQIINMPHSFLVTLY